MNTTEKMLLAALEHAANLISEMQRAGVPAGPVAVPSIINDAIRIATAEDTKEQDAFALYASTFGLTADDFGRMFKFRKRLYKITGCRPKSFKYPILGSRIPDGKTFKFQATDVVAKLVKV